MHNQSFYNRFSSDKLHLNNKRWGGGGGGVKVYIFVSSKLVQKLMFGECCCQGNEYILHQR